ncbi:MAG: acetyl-CoA carboxylase biotin carboxyl carrier protein [Fimbriimonas sp.]
MDRLQQVSDVAALVAEFGLSEVHLKEGSFSVRFSHRKAQTAVAPSDSGVASFELEEAFEPEARVAAPSVPSGIPVSSPMTGIYYGSPSPNAPAFVKEGESVIAGQVVGLIEAMKVFNEIVAPVSGIVTKVLAQSGNIVQPGDPLLYVN